MTHKQLCRYAFTLNGDDVESRVDEIKGALQLNCRSWVFQVERGTESGRIHLQGRVSFKTAKRLPECQKVIRGAHFSPEHDTTAGDFYCTKDDTRIGGPWSDKDAKRGHVWDLEKIKEWKPWQLEIFASLDTYDDRTINVLVDRQGDNGKSKVVKYALWNKMAGYIPNIGDAKDIIQAVCSMGAKRAYMVDLPRTGESEQHLKSIYKAIEQIKNGIVIDFRYQYKELIMGSPVIWIFTNQPPERHFLSADRWKLWHLMEDGTLGAAL